MNIWTRSFSSCTSRLIVTSLCAATQAMLLTCTANAAPAKAPTEVIVPAKPVRAMAEIRIGLALAHNHERREAGGGISHGITLGLMSDYFALGGFLETSLLWSGGESYLYNGAKGLWLSGGVDARFRLPLGGVVPYLGMGIGAGIIYYGGSATFLRPIVGVEFERGRIATVGFQAHSVVPSKQEHSYLTVPLQGALDFTVRF